MRIKLLGFKILCLTLLTFYCVEAHNGSNFEVTVSNELMSESTVLLNTLQDDNLEFTISPNPASTKLNIRLPKGLQNAQVSIFDVLGKKVYSQELNSLTASIDVSKWNSGVYLVKVSTDTFKQTRRFVKQ